MGSSNEISFDLHLISLSSGDCPLSEPWDLGKGMLACAEMTPKFQMVRGTSLLLKRKPNEFAVNSHPEYF